MLESEETAWRLGVESGQENKLPAVEGEEGEEKEERRKRRKNSKSRSR
jgi:hypothetical protein